MDICNYPNLQSMQLGRTPAERAGPLFPTHVLLRWE